MSASESRSLFDLLISTTDEYSKLLPLFEGSVLPLLRRCLEAVKKALAPRKLVTALNGAWESAHLGDQRYDLIVCAHVL
jgi:hypothetical protein